MKYNLFLIYVFDKTHFVEIKIILSLNYPLIFIVYCYLSNVTMSYYYTQKLVCVSNLKDLSFFYIPHYILALLNEHKYIQTLIVINMINYYLLP